MGWADQEQALEAHWKQAINFLNCPQWFYPLTIGRWRYPHQNKTFFFIYHFMNVSGPLVLLEPFFFCINYNAQIASFLFKKHKEYF